MQTIGVFFGSRNPEHDVSIITGQLIISGLRKMGYRVVPIYIGRNGRWYSNERLGNLKFFTDPDQYRTLNDVRELTLNLDSMGKMVFRQKSLLGKKIMIDLAFPAFHGQYGEDGTMQGVFEALNVPYVGCDTTSSAITMDKVLTKMLYVANNIPTTDFIFFAKLEWEKGRDKILNDVLTKLKLPVMVKPARLGSSIGIARAKTQKELEFAIEVAFHYDEKIIVEDYIEDLMDITCAILGNDNPVASLLQESIFNGSMFSYEDKYLNEGGAQLGKATQNIVIPARLDKKTTQEIRDIAIRVFKLFGCSGTSRVDFLYDKRSKKFFANEVNTLPGTLYHHLWNASGVEFEDLLKKLIDLAYERHEKKSKLTSTFESRILKFANSAKLKLKG